jgi:preprotein translocase subunit YajC
MTTDGIGLGAWVLTLAQNQVPGAPPGPLVPGASPGAGETPSTTQPAPSPGPPPPQPGIGTFIWPILIVMVLFILLTSLSGRKERKRREQLLSGVSRNDRVQTVGGIIGTVVELTDNEMVLRVDEASNTRVRFARSALQQILRPAREKGRENGPDVEVKAPVPTRA